MARNKRSKIKNFFYRRKKRSLPNPSCDSTKTSNLNLVENQQNMSEREHQGNVRINGASNHESNLKQARNSENEKGLKNLENVWINRHGRSITSFSQNGFSNASSLKRVQNPNNMTVAHNPENVWVNNARVKQRQNLENLTVSDNRERADPMYNFRRHNNPYTSSFSQMNIYATGSPYQPWWRQSLLPLTDASPNMQFSSRYPPTMCTNITAEPLSKVRSFGSKPAPEPSLSETPFNFPSAGQPNFTSFSFNYRNPVYKFGDAGLPGNSSVSTTERQFIKSRKTAFVRPFPLESTAPSFSRISITAKKDVSPATGAPRNFPSPAFAKTRNFKETTTTTFATMPTTPNCSSFLKDSSSENSRNVEIVQLDDEKGVDTTCKDENDDEIIYLFTVDSTKAIVSEVDLISGNVNVSEVS